MTDGSQNCRQTVNGSNEITTSWQTLSESVWRRKEERGIRDMGSHFFRGATKWSSNVAELAAMIQAMLEMEATTDVTPSI